ncbi:amidase [Hoeflea ulvae]|uniref:Amidase n=1 Tax=Hoeflea ulvae TaxID=2983764 RepID=A0ABT3YKA5_9HYPH|nr:amidase [Hoeflea ulvae]MCY0096062.1 amidase [Hoeflea ulvae]
MMNLAALVRARDAGKAKPELMVALSRDAIARREPAIKAFAHVAAHPEVAKDGPMAGIALGVKDILDTYDQPTSYGSPAYAGHHPRIDSAIVNLARRRGATIIGKTTTTEFAYFQPTETVNPHNPAHTPGGSSSGSAAAVAAGMIPAAIGTQTGGSVIRPAAYCGIAGYKPSYRLLPTTGMKAFAPSLDTIGLFAASVENVALLAALLTGRDLAFNANEMPVVPSSIRVGVYRCGMLKSADPAMRAALNKAADMAADAGFDVGEIGEPEAMARASEAHSTIEAYEAGLACGPDLARFPDLLSPLLLNTLVEGQDISPQDYDAARRLAKRGRATTTALFGEVDILLTPSAPSAAPLGLNLTGDPRFNKLWTLMGTPAVNIPGFKNENGMPLGIQAVARFGQDKMLLAVAALLERALLLDRAFWG